MEENKDIDVEVEEVNKGLAQDVTGAENQALTSMILGIVGLVFGWIVVGLILGIFAIKLAKSSKAVLNNSNSKYTYAIVGEITGWISIVFAIIGIIVFVFVFVVTIVETREIINYYS